MKSHPLLCKGWDFITDLQNQQLVESKTFGCCGSGKGQEEIFREMELERVWWSGGDGADSGQRDKMEKKQQKKKPGCRNSSKENKERKGKKWSGDRESVIFEETNKIEGEMNFLREIAKRIKGLDGV